MSHQVDWFGWLQRWDHQQAGYLPDREDQFRLMLEIVERLVGEPQRFVDLACGPGSISARAAVRFPRSEIVGLDLDRWKGRDITLTDTIQSFRKAGFAEVAVLGQVADKHLFAAIR